MMMFKDNAGRSWAVRIDVDAVKRVRELLDVDLLQVIEGKHIDRLTVDPMFLCDVVYAVCKPQADEMRISDQEFGRAMYGEAFDAAYAALSDGLLAFFPPGRRATLAKLMSKTRTLSEKVLAVAEAKLDDPKLAAAIELELLKLESEIDRVLRGDSSTDVPPSSASIQVA